MKPPVRDMRPAKVEVLPVQEGTVYSLSVRQAVLIGAGAGWMSFVGGLATSGQMAVAAGAAVMGLFSLVVGILVVAPLAGRHGAERFMGILEDRSPEARARKQLVVLTLAQEVGTLLEAERSLPPDRRPVHAAARALMDVMAGEGEQALQGLEGGIAKVQKRLGGLAAGDMLAEVKEAQKAGIIDEKTAGVFSKIALAEKFMARLEGRRGQTVQGPDGRPIGRVQRSGDESGGFR